MENLTNKTPTELLKIANDLKKKHERLKNEISHATFQIEELEIEINEKLTQLEEVEGEYVSVVEEIDKR